MQFPARSRIHLRSLSRSLIVLPDDSARLLLDAIEEARSSLSIKMFLFTEPALITPVSAARSRGVRVRVLLNPARRDDRIAYVKTLNWSAKAFTRARDYAAT